MRNSRSRMYAAVIGALSMGATVAWATEPARQDVTVDQLEAKVAALEAKQAANSKDMAATIDSVLRDAEKRSQLLATSGDMSAGYQNGFFLSDGHGFLLRPSVLFQFRNVTDYRENVTDSKSKDWENGT